MWFCLGIEINTVHFITDAEVEGVSIFSGKATKKRHYIANIRLIKDFDLFALLGTQLHIMFVVQDRLFLIDF